MATGDDVVAAARRELGAPYVYGATGPGSFDCSGLVQYVFHQLGINLPRTSEEQATVGTPVTVDQLQPGDLVFSAGSDGTAAAPGHVGIYAGSGRVIVAPHTGTDVMLQRLDGFGATAFRRPPGLDGTASGATDAGLTVPGLPGLGTVLGSVPSGITDFFGQATDDLTASAAWVKAFFQPSTYIRIGAGVAGTVFLITGLVFLVREVTSG